MAFYLKKRTKSRGLYLAIYQSFREPGRKNPRSLSYKTLGYVDDLIAKGIDDPVSFYQQEVDQLNESLKNQKLIEAEAQISELSAAKFLGYFPFKRVLNRLDIFDDFQTFASVRNFHFSSCDLLQDLIYARCVYPCSKHKTAEEIIPNLYSGGSYSYDQILEFLGFIGFNYEKIIELFTEHTKETYILDTKKVLFDCTNFFFEIDRETDWLKKGPSKENRKDPILGMALMLDANAIPIGMHLYPGNQSEKPEIRDMIDNLKRTSHIEGRTIQVADKGLNCAQNIISALDHGDGYIFSRSVKQLPETELSWVLDENGWEDVRDKDGHLEYKYKFCTQTCNYQYQDENGRKYKKSVQEKRIVTYNKSLAVKQTNEIKKEVEKAKKMTPAQLKKSVNGDSAKYAALSTKDTEGKSKNNIKIELNVEKIDKDLSVAGYNMLVTSEAEMSATDIYDAYHQLWKIENTFRCLKSQLEARPVYLQKQERINGHFLICYLSVLLQRLLEFKELDNQFSPEEIHHFAKTFKVVEMNAYKYINLGVNDAITVFMRDKWKIPITNMYLKKSNIKKILDE